MPFLQRRIGCMKKKSFFKKILKKIMSSFHSNPIKSEYVNPAFKNAIKIETVNPVSNGEGVNYQTTPAINVNDVVLERVASGNIPTAITTNPLDILSSRICFSQFIYI